MKLSAILFVTMASQAAAFAPVRPSTMSKAPLKDSPLPDTEAPPEEKVQEPVFASSDPKMSESLPFMEVNPVLDGSMAGDVGFDPLSLAKTKDDLMNYREAEVKHGRLAMLAAAGWPLSELLDKSIAKALSLPPVLDATDRAPSLLNGGLGKISPAYWIVVLAAAAAIDLYGINKSKENDPSYFPGNLGFDPLGLYPKEDAAQMRMQLAEIKHGRLAMIAIFGFAGQEAIRGMGVVDGSAIFFKPAGTVMKEYANSGYYIPDN